MPSQRSHRRIPPYNPLDEDELARVVTARLESQPLEPFPPEPFLGSGLYALYYRGDFPAYRGLVGTEIPLYVGKAEAGSGRVGRPVADSASTKLLTRIRKHAGSIDAAVNLDLAHFRCRFLVMSDAWIVLGEQGLLRSYAPVWNSTLAGFGNNPLGVGRVDQKRAPWDTVHPGREPLGTKRAPNQRSAAEWMALVEARIGEQRAALGLPPANPA